MAGAGISRFRLISLRELVTQWGRVAACLAVVAVSAALVVAVLATYSSITDSVDRLSKSIAGKADLIVTGYTDSGFEVAASGDIAKTPGVAAAAPVLQQQVNAEGKSLMLLGFDASILALQTDLQAAVGPLLNTNNGVAVGHRAGFAVGDHISLGGETATVATVLSADAGGQLNGGRFIAAPLGFAQKLTAQPGRVSMVLVAARPGTDLGRLRTDLVAVVGQRAVVSGPDLRTAQAENAVAISRSSTLLVATIGLVVAGFLVFNSMNMMVAQRRSRIAVMRAVGAGRRQLTADLILEAVLIGGIGALIGSPIGYLAGRWAIGQVPPILVQSLTAELTLSVPWAIFPIVFLACVLACVAAAAHAAVDVYRVSPLEALQTATITISRSLSRRTALLLGSVAIACLAGAFVMAGLLHGPLAFAAAAIFMVGGILFGIASMGPTTRLAARIAESMGRPGLLAAAAIRRAPGRAWAAAVTTSIAVAVAIGIHGSLTDTTAAAVAASEGLRDAEVIVANTPSEAVPSVGPLPADWRTRVQAVPGVAAVGEGQWAYVTVGELRVAVEGVSPSTGSATAHSLSPDQRRQLDRGEGIAVSRQLAERLGYSVGAEITLGTPTGPHPARIIGTVDVLSLDAGTIAMSLSDMQSWFARPGATYLALTPAPGIDPASLRDTVAAALPKSAYVFTGEQAYRDAVGNIEQAGVLTVALQWIIAAVVVAALTNIFTLAVLQRRRELGVLRAIGSSRKLTTGMVLAEAAAIGLVGAAWGTVFGLGVHYLAGVISDQAIGITVGFRPAAVVVGYTLCGGILACFLGALLPALRAARTNIIAAVSFE
ncbi:ABC transporter permease [Nocardia sp. NPDC056000]|uniref:ABC transporter permease n=1 Tax=Nocardia sp. NPDC056000 TaxID=3345674 RepID=UPI0035DB81A8